MGWITVIRSGHVHEIQSYTMKGLISLVYLLPACQNLYIAEIDRLFSKY